MTRLPGRVLNAGTAEGPVMVLDQPLSFWGGFDPRTGAIIDRHHPQAGQNVAGQILVLPASRGSGGTPGGIAEAMRRGTGPAGIILKQADVNLAVGSFVAGELYGRSCPVIEVEVTTYDQVAKARHATIAVTGAIEIA